MKGIVFTEFLEMVEDKFGYETVDIILAKSKESTNGIYTSIGTYKHSELVALITSLSEETKLSIPKLLHAYGVYLFDVFLKSYPMFFEHVKSMFDFLENIDSHIHKEVVKLYPDAELPKFESNRVNDKHLIMVYYSQRKMVDFGMGLIEASSNHFNTKIDLTKTLLGDQSGDQVQIDIKIV